MIRIQVGIQGIFHEMFNVKIKFYFIYIDVFVLATIESLFASSWANGPSRRLSIIDVYSPVLLSVLRSIFRLFNDDPEDFCAMIFFIQKKI